MAVKNNVEDHVQEAAVWLRAQRLPTDVVLTVARLRYLARMMGKAPPVVRVVADSAWGAPDSWGQLIVSDL
eukprot:5128015-Pyramimonas_sp.AAC.1